MKTTTETLMTRLRCQARDLARGSARIAREAGPTRILLGLGVAAGAATGVAVLVRYLRARADEQLMTGDDAPTTTDGLDDPVTTGGRRHRRLNRARRRALNTHLANP